MASYKQELNAQEEKLFRVLSRIYRNIKRDINIQLSNGRPAVSWGDIQFLYRTQVNDAVRSAVTSIYEISARKTVERDIRLPYFLTEQDVQEIRRLSQRYQDWLWIGLEREIVKKTMTAFDHQTFMRLDPAHLKLKDTFIGRMTESLHGEVAAEAVISKARQMFALGRSQAVNRLRPRSFRQAAIIIGTGEAEEKEIAKRGEPYLKWITAEDEKTCPICFGLEGTIFSLQSHTAITRPVQDTHPRCRCILQLIDPRDPEEHYLTIDDLYGVSEELSEDLSSFG